MKSYGSILKAVALLLFIIVSVIVVRFTPVREFFTAQKLGEILEQAGLWAPLAFVVVYAVGACMFVPGLVLTTLGAALFGAYWGFVYVWVGAVLGASLPFFIGRYLGRDFAASLIGDRLRKYDDSIEHNGFAAVLYLRLAYFPYTPMNYGMGLTKVRFWDYFWGTALGMVGCTFILTFLLGTLKEIWVSGEWAQLFSWKIISGLAVFVCSFFIPKFIGKVVKMNGRESASGFVRQ